MPDSETPIDTCCDSEQIATFANSIKLAANFLKRCPSCMMNLVRHLCDFTCSPQQSNFMEIVATKDNGTLTNGTYITEVNLYVTNDYLNGTYGSCKQVSVPSTGQLALDLMCGSWGAAKCTPLRWFTFMGQFGPGNPFVPFQINYKNASVPTTHNKTTYYPMNPPITPCSQAFDVSIF